MKKNKEKFMVCAIDGCNEIDWTNTAYCTRHGRSTHIRITEEERAKR